MNQSNNFEDEINLSRIYVKFVTYKTLILTITLFFSIAVSVFTIQIKSQYKSIALIEIGNYKTIDGVLKPIESVPALINNVNINLLYKNNFGDKNGYQITPMEGSIVQIQRKSYSINENEQSLKKIIDFIINRHKDISDAAINPEIKSIETELKKINNIIFNTFRASINKLEHELPYLENKISEIDKIIKANEKNLLALESNPELLLKQATDAPKINQVIHDYKIKKIDLEKQRQNVIFAIEKYGNTQNLPSDSSDVIAGLLENSNEASNLTFDLIQKKINLETQITHAKIQNETKIINKITSSELDNKKPLIIVAGVFIGFLISLIVSFIIDSIKKEN